jgi:hypothetical protein
VLRTMVWTGSHKVALLNAMLDGGHELTEPIIDAVNATRHVVALVLQQAQDAHDIRQDVSVTEVFTLARALAHVATPDTEDTIDNIVGILIDGLAAHPTEMT